jgi:hypothetical protein
MPQGKRKRSEHWLRKRDKKTKDGDGEVKPLLDDIRDRNITLGGHCFGSRPWGQLCG